MARESVTTQMITREGLALPEPMATPTPDGDVVDAGRVALLVENVGASPQIVTVHATVAQDGLDLEDLIVSVPAGEAMLVGPFPARTFAQPISSPDAGRVYVDYQTAADMRRMVVGL